MQRPVITLKITLVRTIFRTLKQFGKVTIILSGLEQFIIDKLVFILTLVLMIFYVSD